MNRNYIIFLIITVLFIFTSCVITRDFHKYPVNRNYLYTGDRPVSVSGALSGIESPYRITLFLANFDEDNRENIQSVQIDECSMVYQSGKSIDLLEKITAARFVYHYISGIFPDPSYEIIKNIQLQLIDGNKVLHIENLNYGSTLSITFNIKIPVLTNSIRLDYSFTVVWENSIKERHQGSIFFEREFKTWTYYTT